MIKSSLAAARLAKTSRVPSVRVVAMAAALVWSACTANTVITPARSLDRPSDVQVVCAYVDPSSPTAPTNQVMLRPLSECTPPSAPPDLGTPSLSQLPRLFLLITNTNRGELALAGVGKQNVNDPADGGAGVIDLDPKESGFSFLPVGSLPELLRLSDDQTRAVTANSGSCDLTTIDVLSLLQRAVAVDGGALQSLSTAASRIAPNVGGKLLNARPTWIEMSPATQSKKCAPGNCAIVAFPGCQLVAEIELLGGNVTQAVKITKSGAQVVADLSTIDCFSECGTGGTAPDLAMSPDTSLDMNAGVPDGGMGTPPPLVTTSQGWPSTFALARSQSDVGLHPIPFVMIVGDAYGSVLTAIALDGQTGAFGAISTITLDGQPGGVERVRLSPSIPNLNNDRFLYAIARDRTVRVVDIDADNGPRECETNPDQAELDRSLFTSSETLNALYGAGNDGRLVAQALRCLPVGARVRAALAMSPGISLPGNALPRDVLFTRNRVLPSAAVNTTDQNPIAAPGVMYGDFAWIVDSSEKASAVNLADNCSEPNILPTTPIQPSCQPGNVGPSLKIAGDYKDKPLPSSIDVMPHRLRSGTDRYVAINDLNTWLSAGTSGAPRLSALPAVSVSNGAVNFADPAIYKSTTNLCSVKDTGQGCVASEPNIDPTAATPGWNFVRFRDPTRVVNEIWTLSWEGLIPGTQRAAGSVDRTSISTAALADASAVYCSRGVQVGDKVYLTGCADDNGCSAEQTCFLDVQRPAGAGGLCLNRDTDVNHPGVPDPAVVNTDSSRQKPIVNTCAPWTQSVLRYRIGDVRQTDSGSHLVLEEIAEPEYDIDTLKCTVDTDCAKILIPATVDNLPGYLPTRCLDNGHGIKQCLRACELTTSSSGLVLPAKGTAGACGAGFTCVASDFFQGPRCVRAPLPPTKAGSGCFLELQSYEIHGGDAFIVSGSSTGFLRSAYPDPASGACVAPGSSSPQRLLTGRIPIGAASCAGTDMPSWLHPQLPGAAPACSLSAVDGSTDLFLKFENPIFDLVVHVPQRQLDRLGNVLADVMPPPVATTHVPLEQTVIGFNVLGGFHPLSFTLSSDIAAQMPRSGAVGPDGTTLFVVDEGKQTSPTGLRGQVVRFFTNTQTSDNTFQVR